MQHLDIRILGDRKYQSISDVIIETSKYKILIAKGAIFNGADIPQAFWSMIGCPLDFALESLAHDILYRSRVLSRYDSDNVFYELLKQQGVDAVTSRKLYLGVRIGGSEAYEDAMDTMSEYREFVRVEPNVSKNVIINKN